MEGSSKSMAGRCNLRLPVYSSSQVPTPILFPQGSSNAMAPRCNLRLPVYSPSQVLEKLQRKRQRNKEEPAVAMYSSLFGWITLDPALMCIPIDDHMVHSGHGVFDTTVLIDGYLYELDAHLDRLLTSATKAKISLPFPYKTLRTIIIKLTAASQCKEGMIRYWLSSGPGDFRFSPEGCSGPAFYAVVIKNKFSKTIRKGIKVITSTVPMKSPLLSIMKSVKCELSPQCVS